MDLAARCGACRLALFHHSPARSDHDVDAIARAVIEEGARLGVDVFVARDETALDWGLATG